MGIDGLQDVSGGQRLVDTRILVLLEPLEIALPYVYHV
jgi:hypothetical protein